MKISPIIAALGLLSVPLLAEQSRKLTSPDQVPEGLQKSDWQSIHAAHSAWQHEFRQVEGKWQSRNPGQQWTTTFDGRGFLAKPQAAEWTWGLELKSYGIGANQVAVSGIAESSAVGQKLTYRWQGGLEEWYVNDQQGLEHGYTLAQRPEGAQEGEPLVFTLGTLGELKPSVSSDAQTVYFRDQAGAPILNYAGLKVWDADGKILPSHFEPSVNAEFRLVIEETGAKYPVTIDPIAQQAYLKAGNNGADSSDLFGYSVAVSGDTVVVGAVFEDSATTGVNSTPNNNAVNSGAVYVFVRSGSTWSQQAYLKASNTGSGDAFGGSVAVSGDTLVVGAASENSFTTGVNSMPNNDAERSGAAYVFIRSSGIWSQQAYLKASNTQENDSFGTAVAVSGDTVVVGSPYEDGGSYGVNGTSNESSFNSGAAYVFKRTGTGWSQQAYLKASNTSKEDYFGTSAAINGDTIVVGAIQEDSNTTGVNSSPNNSALDSGAAYVFIRSGSTWSQQAYIKASNTGIGDRFGQSVALSGDTLVVGAQYEDSTTTGVNSTPDNNSEDAGAAYVFIRVAGSWSQQAYLKPSNTQNYDSFGYSVAVSGDTVVVGAVFEDSSTMGVNSTPSEAAEEAGAAYVFIRSGSAWSQQAYIKASNTGAGDLFGWSVAISGETLIIGVPYEDSNTTGANSTPNNNATDSGASYVLTRSGSSWSQQSYLKASNTQAITGVSDNFGTAVAVSGETVVVGSPYEDGSSYGVNGTSNESSFDSGAAYVFKRTGTSWSQQAYLKASNTSKEDYFGTSVAINGDTVVVGAIGEDSSTTGVNSSPNNNALESGAAYVFIRSGSTWSQQAYLKASNTGVNDYFGKSVAVSVNTVIVGASGEDSSTTGVNSASDENADFSGAAYVFIRDGTTWSQQAYIKASNTDAYDVFGVSVAVSGETVIIGAIGEDSDTTGVNSVSNNNSDRTGAAYIFRREGSIWTQQAYLKAFNSGREHSFGHSVSVSDDTVVVGAPYEHSSTTGVNSTPNEDSYVAGAAYVFVGNGSIWSQQAYLKASNTLNLTEFGNSVSVSGDIVVIGASAEYSNASGINGIPNVNLSSSERSGAAYVFASIGDRWGQLAYLKASNAQEYDSFGVSVAVSGDTVIVGSAFESSSSTGVNNPSNESAPSSGAAYIFTGFGPEFLPPSITTPTSISLTENDARFGGTVTFQGGAAITGRGVVYSAASVNPTPAIGGSGVTQLPASGTTGVLSVLASSLLPRTTYMFRAYATNSNGTSYTIKKSFTTPPYTLTTSSTNGAILRSPDLSSYSSGSVVTLTAVPSRDMEFRGWEGDLSGMDHPAMVTMDANKTVSAVFFPTLSGALDTSGMIFTNDGRTSWLPQTVITHDGVDAAESGAVGNFQESSLQTQVIGPGSLSFWWRVSSESNSDWLEFHLNGRLSDRISGTSGSWIKKSYSIGSGLTTLKWTYTKDDGDVSGSDRGWVDEVVFISAATQAFTSTMTAAGLSGPNALPSAIPHNDGVKNLLKYAFNMNLSGPDVRGLIPSTGTVGLPIITASRSGATTTLRVEFIRRIGSGLIYTPKRSDNLSGSSWIALTDTPTVTPINASWERVIYEEPFPTATTPKCFGVVEVTLP